MERFTYAQFSQKIFSFEIFHAFLDALPTMVIEISNFG